MKKYNKVSFKYINKYYSRSIAISISIILSTVLIVGIGTLSKTAQKAEVDIIKYDTGNSHLRISNIDEKQLEWLNCVDDINNIGVTSLYGTYNYKDKVLMNIVCANEEYIKLDNGKIKEGNFPNNSNEIAIEEWVLKNLNIQPKIGSNIEFKLDSGESKTFKLSGILSDIPSKKSSGMVEAIIGFDSRISKSNLMAFIEFDESSNILACIYDIQDKLKIEDEDLSINTMLLDALNKFGSIDWNIINISIIVSIIVYIVIYGIFNISIYQRNEEYGILRAMGAKKEQIFNIIFTELFVISVVSLPVGMAIGVISAKLLSSKFSQLFTEFDISSHNILISREILALSIVLILIIITIIALKMTIMVAKISPIDAIRGIRKEKNNVRKNRISINTLSRLISYHRAISVRNISENKKSFIMIIISMSLGSILFIVSSYYSNIQSQLSTEKLQQTKVNYDYKIVTNGTLNMDKGLTKEAVDDIKNIKGIEDVNPSKIVYARTLLDKEKILEPLFFEILENNSPDWDTPVKELSDNKSMVIQSNIWGYNDQALKELDKFLVDGEINIDRLKEDNSAIVYVPTMSGQGSKKVADVKSGDIIEVEFREDGKVSEEFYGMKDTGKYKTEKFKVAGIITTLPVWDDYYSVQDGIDIIIPEENFNNICGFDSYRILHANKSINSDNGQVFEQILNITNSLEGVNVRDLSKERIETEGYYKAKDSYVYVISIVLFLISMLNITNNVSYRLISRTKEFGMIRAMGLDNKAFKEMIIFEGVSFGIISSIVTIVLGVLIQIFMFKYFSIFLKNPKFDIQFINYILIIFINIVIGIGATYIPLRKIKKLSIVESIKSIQ